MAKRPRKRSHSKSKKQNNHSPRKHDAGAHPARGGGGRGHSPRGDSQTLKGRIDKNRKGFGFVILDAADLEDVFLPPRQAENLFHGDRVEVVMSGSGKRARIERLRVIEHRFRELVGRYHHVAGRGFVVYEKKRAREEIIVPKLPEGMGRIADGAWVFAKLKFHDKGPHAVTAEITEVYGEAVPPRADLPRIAAEFSLVEEHPEAAVAQAKAARLEVPGRDLEGRVDLRKMPLITIDGETARDFDDAVYVEKSGSGYTLWVAIADVSHYVTEGTPLDQDARSRGTSVYFPERAFHMLPAALSENLCSLKPREPRLAMTAKITLDIHGKKQRIEVMESVIESKRRATYNEIENEWKQQGKSPQWEFKPHFELYEILRKHRQQRGSIDFDLPEAEVVVEPTGEVISIKNRPRLNAHRLIEEFMICANEAVTEWALSHKWPFIYRIHEEPSGEALERLRELAATVGIQIKVGEGIEPKVLADAVRQFQGHAAEPLLNMTMLRSMKQAVYASTHGIHFGLASQGYTHFTSPIRRYPDLVVHRLLRQILRKKKPGPQIERELTDIAEHCSYRERIASDAERESIKTKQVRLMATHLGSEFDGRIVGMAEHGFYVQLGDPYVEGLVPQESLQDDHYQFNEQKMLFVGSRKRRMFKIGDTVKIQVVRADLDRNEIEFSLVALDAQGQAKPASLTRRVER